jgi:hypothetical protein
MEYLPILPSGDSSPYFGTYEGQHLGNYDLSTCWDFSACELAETRLEMLWQLHLMSQDDFNWLNQNGYIDETGDFYLSRRWVAILSGVTDHGNQSINFWEIAKTSGLIPNSLLPYDHSKASQFLTDDAFDNDYFNPNVITQDMIRLGLEFIKRFNIDAEIVIGGFMNDLVPNLPKFLKEGSVHFSIPVPHDGSWNQQFVNYPVGNVNTDHAVECYKFDPTQPYPFYIYDSYEPHLKQLSANYLVPRYNRVHIIPVNPPKPPITPPVVPIATPVVPTPPIPPTPPPAPIEVPSSNSFWTWLIDLIKALFA